MKSARRLVRLALVPALALCALGAAAQYVGPSTIRKPTVAEILKRPVDDQAVIVQGYLLRKVGRKHYEFSDGTGSIRVEIKDQLLPAQPINDKTLVELHGEVEKDFVTSPEIEVDSLRILPAR